MIKSHIPRDDQEAPADTTGSLPVWTWDVTWEEDDPRLIALPKEFLWRAAWNRMVSTHHILTPALIERLNEDIPKLVATWQSRPGHADMATPIWTWRVQWTSTGEDWENLAQDALWYKAWQRMIVEHRFITPAKIERRLTPRGLVGYAVTWESRPTSGDGSLMLQKWGCYESWLKPGTPWVLEHQQRYPDEPW